MRKSENAQLSRDRADLLESEQRIPVGASPSSTSFVKRRQFLFMNLKKRSSQNDGLMDTLSPSTSPSKPSSSIFYQPLDPPQRPIR